MGRVAVGLVAGLLGVTMACGGDDDDDTEAGGEGAEQVAVCSDYPYPPMEFEEDGEFTGFDIELMREVGERANLDIDFKEQEWDALESFQAVAAGDCDLIASSMTITEERAEKALFSDPYFDAHQSLLVLEENEDKYGDLESLAGQTIGVQTDTTGATYAEENKPEGATVKDFLDVGEMFLALESNQIQGVLQDKPANRDHEMTNENTKVVADYDTDEQYGIAADKEDEELIGKVNDALAEIEQDGTYDDLYMEWFDEEPPKG